MQGPGASTPNSRAVVRGQGNYDVVTTVARGQGTAERPPPGQARPVDPDREARAKPDLSGGRLRGSRAQKDGEGDLLRTRPTTATAKQGIQPANTGSQMTGPSCTNSHTGDVANAAATDSTASGGPAAAPRCPQSPPLRNTDIADGGQRSPYPRLVRAFGGGEACTGMQSRTRGPPSAAAADAPEGLSRDCGGTEAERRCPGGLTASPGPLHMAAAACALASPHMAMAQPAWHRCSSSTARL